MAFKGTASDSSSLKKKIEAQLAGLAKDAAETEREGELSDWQKFKRKYLSLHQTCPWFVDDEDWEELQLLDYIYHAPQLAHEFIGAHGRMGIQSHEYKRDYQQHTQRYAELGGMHYVPDKIATDCQINRAMEARG